MEIGQLNLQIKMKIDSFEFQIFSESRQVARHYFDPYCTSHDQIKAHLAQVEDLLKNRGEQLDKILKTGDKKANQLSELAVDLAHLRQLKDQEEALVNKIADKLFKLQNVDELHIEIDVLQ